jgi:hypothetical protein
MIPRLTFVSVTVFWIAMNALLWRAEYGLHGAGVSVPVDLVWRKILTAPDVSSLTVFQDGHKTGFCQFSTSVEQAMAALDEDKLPPEGIVARAGYKIQFDGNVSLGEFTNRLNFSGRLQFSSDRAWRELNLKLASRPASVEIHSFAADQSVHLKFNADGAVIEHDFTFAELQNPGALLNALAGNFGGGPMNGWVSSAGPQTPDALAGNLRWEAHHERLMLGREPVSAYRLETRVLDHPVVIDVSTLGEILRVELPGGITATIDQWGKS